MDSSTDREQVLAHVVSLGGFSPEQAQQLVDALTAEQLADYLQSLAQQEADKAALRDRLHGTVLGRAVCPGADWKTAQDRYDVARRAVRIVDATAEKHGITADQLAQALVDTHGTLAESIAMHGTDPRADTYLGGPDGFYAFRWRVRDALEHLGLDEDTQRKRAAQARREAEWERRGLVRCDRCGGAGGRDEWPGWDCFDCGGLGGVTPRGQR